MRLVRAQPLYQQAYTALRQAILTGAIKPGERLTEVRLAEMLSISRTPVRESIRQLVKDGLLETTEAGGVCVPRLAVESLLQLYQCRGALERLAASLAAARATEDQVAAMVEKITQAEACIRSGDLVGLIAANTAFHDCIYQASGNRFIGDLIERARGPLLLYRASSLWSEATRTEVHREHEAILIAIQARDPMQAAMRMDLHMQGDMDRLLKFLPAETNGDGPAR